MSCCESRNKNCSRPKEEMLSPETITALLDEGSWVLKKLLDIARGGARFVGFKNDHVNELAALISSVVAENNYLKGLLGVFHPGKAKAGETGVTLMFGPSNEYTLFIPALTEEARAKLGASLIEAGKDLTRKKETVKANPQQYLPFSS
jgi:hypothetical protein